MDAMVLAGWLKAHTWTEGKGHHLVWNPEGAQRAGLLRLTDQMFGLTQADEAAHVFHVACTGDRLLPAVGGPVEIDDSFAEFFTQCSRELGLDGDEDGLMAMVHIAVGWGPDPTRDLIVEGIE